MDLCINTLLEHIDTADQARVDRIIGFSGGGAVVTLIEIRSDAMPRDCERMEIEQQIAAGELRPLQSDPYANLSRPEDQIPESHRSRRNRAWSLIETIIELPDGGAFKPKIRGPVINRICRETRTSKWLVYFYLRRFWQGGMRKNALLPKFKNCGAPGKNRNSKEAKRGRPREINGGPPGVNVTKEMRRLFQLGIKALYENKTLRLSLHEAYERTIERYFNRGYEVVNGTYTPITPPAGEVPTYEQFRYWYRKDCNRDEALRTREGQRRYDLRHRALGGDASAVAFGPGSVFQIDSTIADIYLVSLLDRKRIIGRPILYLVVDVFSRMITGFCAVIENASYNSAVLALENVAQDKVEFCAKYGIAISEFEWPSAHFPELLVADRAELLGNKSNHLVDTFGFRISNAPPHRADLKPFVERLFHSINQELIHSLPGAVQKKRERGDRDYRLDAALTLHEFRKAVIYFILHHNRSVVGGYRPRDFMLSDSVEARPCALWRWGIQNRSGHLLKHNAEFVRQNLLPGDQGTITAKGIRFRNLYYTSTRAVAEHWFATARQEGSWRIDIAYDPLQTSTIYLRLPSGAAPEQCQLMEASSQFKECSWEDVDDFFSGIREMHDRSRTTDMQEGALYHARIDNLRENALEKQKAAGNGESKAARIHRIRPNRRLEREIERRAGMGDVACETGPAPGKPLPSRDTGSEIADSDYVGLPMDFDTLEQQREELCNNL